MNSSTRMKLFFSQVSSLPPPYDFYEFLKRWEGIIIKIEKLSLSRYKWVAALLPTKLVFTPYSKMTT